MGLYCKELNFKNINMRLNLKERVLILSSVLPQFDSKKNTYLKMSIVQKIAPTKEEEGKYSVRQISQNTASYEFDPEHATSVYNEYFFTDEELLYMKHLVDFMDKNNLFTVDALETYEKISYEALSEGVESEI
jgi:hypothetical protein